MRVLLRADASPGQGTGHVMRCLTLSEALKVRGHEVFLITNHSGVSWLEENLSVSSVDVEFVAEGSLDEPLILSYSPDWVVVDSYLISSSEVSKLNLSVPTMAIIDGDDRGIVASAYLDQNLGAGRRKWGSHVQNRILAGSKYVLIRNAVIEQRPSSNSDFENPPHILAVMGGSDPTGAIVDVCKALKNLSLPYSAKVIVDGAWKSEVAAVLQNGEKIEVIEPTTDLPELFASADIAISASGTSAWELCTLAKPSIFIALVDNQVESLGELVKGGFSLGIDAVGAGKENLAEKLGLTLVALLNETELRKDLITACKEVFDGKGKYRVVEFLESSYQPIEEK